MKTPRQEQPWYESRLLNNKKPSPITDEERTILTDENRRLIEQSAQISEWGTNKGRNANPEPWLLDPSDAAQQMKGVITRATCEQ